ncbi:MAG: dihydropteroate synthase [Patescibacteria group bacterium]
MISVKKISTAKDAQNLLSELGCDPPGVMIMSKKMQTHVFHLRSLDIRAANILKQDALSFGGELALSKEASFLRAKKADGVLMVNQRQLEQLIGKLKGQPFGLRAVAEALQRVFTGMTRDFGLPRVMGVLNITSDSFSDGGKFVDVSRAVTHAKALARDGAHIIDIGGESTGPGSKPVSEPDELARIAPVLKELKKSGLFDNHGGHGKHTELSIDTYKSEVARFAIVNGASIVNDVTALRGDKNMAKLVAESGVQAVLMYAKDNTPRTTRVPKKYKDVIHAVKDFLSSRIEFAISQGIKENQIIIDPGMGAFVSSDPMYSFEILSRLGELRSLGFPILVGTSRKSFLGGDIGSREEASIATSLLALQNGASIARVHNVKPIVELIKNIFTR